MITLIFFFIFLAFWRKAYITKEVLRKTEKAVEYYLLAIFCLGMSFGGIFI